MTGQNGAPHDYQLGVGEKATSIMAYTDSSLIWGDVITKEAIRVSTWLRTQAIPQYMSFHNATVLKFGGSQPKPVKYRELFLPSALVIAYHITPPNCDPLDYDPKEPMRKMEPATLLIGWFRFDCTMRMSTVTNLERFLDSSKESFTSIYDATISQSVIPGMNAIKVPYALVRGGSIIFAAREA